MNWGPGATGGFYNALAMGMQIGDNISRGIQVGQQRREERDYRNALAQFDPSNPETLKPIMAVRPEVGIQLRGQIERQEASAQQQRMEQLGTFRRLLNAAGTNPQQAFAAAQQMGIDTSAIPQPGTPEFEPWRQQQLFIMDALEKEGDNLPGLAQEVMLALPEDQRDPNSPAFRQAFTAALENKYAAEYTDAQGNTRRRAIIGQTQAAPQATAPILPRSARPQGMTDDQLFAQARQAVENGASVDAVFRQLREWGVEVN